MMKYLLVLLVLFVVGDGLVTRFLLDGGLAREGNPFLQPLVGENGFLALKMVGALVCAFILWDIHRRFPRVALVATWFFVIAYWGIVLWNVSIFIRG
jgi:hypothetical protein